MTGGGRLNDWISIMGLYKWNPNIMNSFHIPSRLDKNILTAELLSRLAELEILYPHPEVFETILDAWSFSRLPVWEKLCDTLEYEYNPLETYNMDVNRNQDNTGNVDQKDSNASSRTGGRDTTSKETDGTVDTLNSNSTNNSESTYSGNSKDNYSGNVSKTGTDNTSESKTYNEQGNTTDTENNKELEKGNDAQKSVEQDTNYVYGFNSADRVTRNMEEDSVDTTDEWNTDRTITKDAKGTSGKTGEESGTVKKDYDETVTDSNERTVTDSNSEKIVGANSKEDHRNINTTIDKALGETTHEEETGKLDRNISTVENEKEQRKSHGNTGLYSAQTLIEQQRMIVDYSVYEVIITEFKKRFCLQVW